MSEDKTLEKFISEIEKVFQSAYNIEATEMGFITKDTFHLSGEKKKYWVDGYQYSFYLRYLGITSQQVECVERFLGQKINVFSLTDTDVENVVISFGGGLCAFNPIELNHESEKNTKPVNHLKLDTDVEIPIWFDDFVFSNIGAKFSPDHHKFSRNIDLSGPDIKSYMGTYGMRSFGESKVIFSDLFSSDIINEKFADKPSINILDFGAGTGGNLAGLIVAVNESFYNPPALNIVCIDGNKYMLDYVNHVLKYIQERNSSRLIYKTIHHIVRDEQDLEHLCDLADKQTDIIMSFKCLSEITTISDIYYKFTKILSDKLTQNGVLVILDVTTKDNQIDFNPILLNEGISRFEKESNFRSIIPVSCGHYSKQCFQKCFTQQQFRVSHSRRKNDLSKVAYRIVAREILADEILRESGKSCFAVKWNYDHLGQCNPSGACRYCNSTYQIKDAYTLKSVQ